MASKTESGSRITLLGVELDLQNKTARIPAGKALNIEADANLILKTGTVTSRQLAIFFGRLEFASLTCQKGRIFTRAIARDAGNIQAITLNNLSDFDAFELSAEALSEVHFWSGINSHPPLKIGVRKYKNGNVMASDASSKKWAVVIGDRSFADLFPEKFKNSHINIKEAFAVAQLIKKSIAKDTDFEILCDNNTVVGAFNKQRSSNHEIHELITSSVNLLVENNSRMKLKWISTTAMEAYADGPSRGIYRRDDYGLTTAGIDRLIYLAPSFEARRVWNGCVSLFASPANNPARIRYFSLEVDGTDPLCARMDAFQLLSQRKKEGKGISGGVLAYPPPTLISSFNREIRSMGLECNTEIYYLLPADRMQESYNAVLPRGLVKVAPFCGINNKNLLHRKPAKKISLMIISSFDLGNRSSVKRPRY